MHNDPTLPRRAPPIATVTSTQDRDLQPAGRRISVRGGGVQSGRRDPGLPRVPIAPGCRRFPAGIYAGGRGEYGLS